jgi:prepilin peptidase CpaA
VTIVRDVALVVLMAVACWTDVRTRKIKNWLTFPTMLLGIALALFSAVPWAGVAGLFLCLAVCVPLWRIGPVLSAGDVKMLMAAGALLGPEHGVRAVLFTVALGLPAGLVALAVAGRLGGIGQVLRGRAAPTMLWHAPVVSAGILAAWLQPWPNLW